MQVSATGFVSEDAGSVASANTVILRELLARGISVDFLCKPSFVYPHSLLAKDFGKAKFRVIDCTNHFGDQFRRFMARGNGSLLDHLVCKIDAMTYNSKLNKRLKRSSQSDVDLWLGDWAHRELIERLAGKWLYLKLRSYAQWRLSYGTPNFQSSDRLILGSAWSVNFMIDRYRLAPDRLHAIPYPIDLEMFRTPKDVRPSGECLRIFWLGRFVPRKRLDLFLNGLALAIRAGCDVEGWVVGQSGFVPNYEQLIREFPYPSRLKYWPSIPRHDVPKILSQVDVVAQPSDDENFGSAVAEGLACGLPAIVGKTNGTGDYVCDRSIRLVDDHPVTFANAIIEMAKRKKEGELADRLPSRRVAEYFFDPKKIGRQIESILRQLATQDS
jgi:glycosyltransferase involved in cell wall biosynthesis